VPVVKHAKAKDRGKYLPPGQRDWPETLIRVIRRRAQDDFFTVQERDVDFALWQAYRNADEHLNEIVSFWITYDEQSLVGAATAVIARYGASFFAASPEDARAAQHGGIHLLSDHLHNHAELWRWLVLRVAQHAAEAIELVVEDPSLVDAVEHHD